MKNILYIPILLTFSCNNQLKEADQTTIADTTQYVVKADKTDNLKYYTSQDTLFIATETTDTVRFSKEVFNKIVDNHSEFFYDIPENPDKLYSCFVKNSDFGSEQGQDVYYILYAYFLKQKNGIEKYAQQRKQLIDIYSAINSLFAHFQYGGTYFGHQRSRLLGYAEYSIYLYPKNKTEVEKTYDISKQKELYVESLRQLIEDESKIDFETKGNKKIERTKKLNGIVDEINILITDNFYLRRAQAFQYEKYEYH